MLYSLLLWLHGIICGTSHLVVFYMLFQCFFGCFMGCASYFIPSTTKTAIRINGKFLQMFYQVYFLLNLFLL